MYSRTSLYWSKRYFWIPIFMFSILLYRDKKGKIATYCYIRTTLLSRTFIARFHSTYRLFLHIFVKRRCLVHILKHVVREKYLPPLWILAAWRWVAGVLQGWSSRRVRKSSPSSFWRWALRKRRCPGCTAKCWWFDCRWRRRWSKVEMPNYLCSPQRAGGWKGECLRASRDLKRNEE